MTDEESDLYSDAINHSSRLRKLPINERLKECDEAILEHNYNIVLEYLTSYFAYLINVLIFKKDKSYIKAAREVARTLQREGYSLKNFDWMIKNYCQGNFEGFIPHCIPYDDIKMNRSEYMERIIDECERITKF
jgi:hypothetical protein